MGVDGEDDDSASAAEDVTLQTYEANAERYVRASQGPRGQLLAFLDSFADLVGAGSVLELGTGPGWDADHLERRGLQVMRTDGAKSMVDLLRSQGHGARVLDIRKDDFGGPFDGLLANAVLLHLSRDEFVQALSRARGALCSGGVFGFTLKEGDSDAWSHAKLDLPRHFTYWRAAQVRDALETTGWQIRSLEQVSGRLDDWLYVLAQPL